MFKKTKIILALLTVMFCLNTKAQTQESTSKKIVNSDYFHNLDIEKFYVHINKNTFFSGEKIWFKAYVVYDNTNLPSLNTTNVYLNLFNANKQLIDSKLYVSENGYSYGEFPLEKELTGGTYYLQIGTNYSLNFNDVTSQKISIINLGNQKDQALNTDDANENTIIETDQLDLEFYPESNVLTHNIPNKIISKFNIEEEIEGDIIDLKTNKKVSHFKSNNEGIASLFLLYNSYYKAVVNYKNKNYNFNLPSAETKGFNILKTRDSKDAKNFIIKTNALTVKDYDTKSIFAVLHRKGAVKSIAPISIKANQKNYILKFLNNDLFDGLNTITLFNERNQPISERHFYNSNYSAAFQVTNNGIENDSLLIGLQPNKDFNNANISISVHHKDFIAYNTNSGMKSDMNLLKYLPNTSYNFNKAVANNEVNKIDNYLQILSKSYNSYPYKGQTENGLVFKNENGLSISGKLNTKIDETKKYSVLLTSKENNLFLVTELKQNKTFSFDNIYMTHPSKYQLALMNKKGKMINSNFVVYKNYTNYKPELSINKSSNTKTILKEDNTILNDLEYLEFMNFDDVTLLDEVTIESDQTDETIKKDKTLKATGIIGEAYSKSYKIDDSAYNDLTMEQYMQTLSGVTVRYNADGSTSLINERFTNNFSNEGLAVFTISIDGVPQGTDFSLLIFRRVKEFDYVIVNHRGAGYGASFGKGIITFVSKKGDNNKYKYKNKKVKYFESEIGFNEAALKFEAPLLKFGTQTNKNKLDNIDWLPNNQFTENDLKYIKINSTKTKGLMLIINGFNNTGQLIHQVIKL